MPRSEANVSQLVRAPTLVSPAGNLSRIWGVAMGALGSLPVEEIIRSGSIRDVDVLRLRGALQGDGIASADEAELLFRLNEACPSQHPAWADFFVETLTDYVVDQSEPEGYLTTDDAKRLVDRVTSGGRSPRKVELDLVVNVLDKSRWSPVSLSRFALEQVKRAVIDGNGPLRTGQETVRGTIREPEVELVRRILYAFGGDGSVAVTRAEAEVLFDINDAIADPTANPAWADLFVKAITNVVMAASGRSVPTREEALRRDAWLIERGELSPTAVLSAMVRSSLDAVWSAYQDQSPEARAACPARAPAHRDHHQRGDHRGRGRLAVRAHRARRAVDAQRGRARGLPQAGKPGHASRPAGRGRPARPCRVKWRPKATNRAIAPCFAQPTVGRCGARRSIFGHLPSCCTAHACLRHVCGRLERSHQ